MSVLISTHFLRCLSSEFYRRTDLLAKRFRSKAQIYDMKAAFQFVSCYAMLCGSALPCSSSGCGCGCEMKYVEYFIFIDPFHYLERKRKEQPVIQAADRRPWLERGRGGGGRYSHRMSLIRNGMCAQKRLKAPLYSHSVWCSLVTSCLSTPWAELLIMYYALKSSSRIASRIICILLPLLADRHSRAPTAA